MNCPNCGTEVLSGERSCKECGQEVVPLAATVVEPAPTLTLPQSQMNAAEQNENQKVDERRSPMNRIAGIVVLVIGALLLIGYFKFGFPNGTLSGILVMVCGAAIIGLSFVPKPVVDEKAPAPLSAGQRLTGIFFEPAQVFRNLRYHPRWLVAFLIVVCCGVGYQLAVMQRLGPARMGDDVASRIIEGGYFERMQPQLEQQLQRPVSPEDFRQLLIMQTIATATVEKFNAVVRTISVLFLLLLVLGGLYTLGVLAFGGRMDFWRGVAVAAYSGVPPAVILFVLNMILLFIKSPDDMIPLKAQSQGLARADLGLLISGAEHPPILDHPYFYVIASTISLFSLYRWWLAVTGLKNTGEKISGGSAWTIAFLIWILGIIVWMVLVTLAPPFFAA
jgi:hypothetical protein